MQLCLCSFSSFVFVSMVFYVFCNHSRGLIRNGKALFQQQELQPSSCYLVTHADTGAFWKCCNYLDPMFTADRVIC